MRLILPLGFALLLASPTFALPVNLFRAAIGPGRPDVAHTFRISTSESAYLEIEVNSPGPGGGADFSIGDSPAVDAFIAALTNGVNDPLTFTNGVWSHTVDELHLLGEVKYDPFIAYGYLPLIPGQVDAEPYTIDYLRVIAGNELYSLEAHGNAPEPSSAVLLMLGAVGLHLRRAARRQLIGR